MKKYNKFGYAGTMLLAGLVSFSACSSDDELADVNPTYDGESVKTQFTISVPRAAKSGRMTGTNVQHDGENFRGMENIKLYPFKTASPGTLVDAVGSYDVAVKRIDLPFIASGTTDENSASNKIGAKMYTNVSIPVHTNAFLLYGEAIRNGQDDFVNGNIDASYLEDDANMDIRQKVGSIKFNLKPITTATHTSQGEDAAAGAAILNLLNGVAKAQGWSEASAETALGKAYKAFTGNTVGSSEGVRLMMQDLYNNMQTILAAGTNEVASAVSTAILGDYGVASLAEEGSEVLGSKKLKYNTTSFKFPDKLLIPDGAVQVIWNTSAFEYAQDVNIGVQGNGVATAEWDKYVYPASLYYMANSPIAVSNTTKGSIDVSNQDWAGFLASYENSGNAGAVQNTTQSIAMIDKINYAVGALETKVQLSTKNPPKDHNKQDITELNCQLTGVLVGGQKSVDWNFAPVDATEYTIYDKTANEDITKLTTNPSNVAFYTLAMPTAKDKPVMVALEFVNKGTKAIKCASGYIPVEGKFYLVGKLDPQSGKTYAQDGTNAVFMKDYLTKATFKVTASSLDNAYPVIPDLRTPELELGLAVDLDWKQGLLFEVEM